MKWNAQDIVAIILATVIVLAIMGVILFTVGYDQRLDSQGVDWVGKLLLVIVGALTMFIGVKHNKE